jgi:hypothetical protein
LRLTLVFAAVATLCAATPAAAAPQAAGAPAAPVMSAEQNAKLIAESRVWLTDLGKWAQALQDRVKENGLVMGEMTAGFEKAIELFEKKDRKKGKAWAAEWATAQRARLVRLRELAADTPAPPEPPAALLADRRFAARMQIIRDSGAGISTMLENTAATGERYVELIGAAAGGSVEALEGAIPVTIDSFVISLRGEAAVAEIMAEAADENHPHRDLMISSASLNRSMIVMFEYQRAVLVDADEETEGSAAYAERMGRHIEAARKAAQAMGPHTEKMRAIVAALPAEVTPITGRLGPMLDGMAESASVELEMADEMEKIAAAIREDQPMDSPAVTAALTRVEALALKRVELINARREAFIAAH